MSVWSAPALAQANFDPSRIPEQFRLPPAPEAPPPLPVPPPPSAAPTIDPAAPRFLLQQVQIVGMTALADDVVASVINPYLKRDLSLADLQTVAQQLTQLYRQQGFILSQVIVPPQRIENGVVVLQAVEGHISKLDFTGAEDLWLQASAHALTLEAPLKMATLQRWLLLANDAPGLTVTGQLTPDASTPQGSVLTIDIKRDDVTAVAGFDNRGSRFIGPWQLYTGMQWNGALLRGDMIALRGYTSHPDGQLKYVQLQQAMPVGTDGLRLEATADVVRSSPGDTLKALEAEGKTDAFKLALTYPLIRALTHNLVLGLTAELSNNRTSILDDPKNTPSVNDRTRVLSVMSNYSTSDAAGKSSAVTLTLSRGLDVLHASQGNTLNPSRAGAEPTFWRAIVEGEQRWPITAISEGSSVLLAAKAQHTFGDSLLASEQITAGGNSYGRGFDPAVISGDKGLLIKSEISLPVQEIAAGLNLAHAEPYGFFDAAFVTDEKTAAGIIDTRRLFSAGLGLRFMPTDKLSGYVEGAKQLPISELADGTNPKGFRLTIGLMARF